MKTIMLGALAGVLFVATGVIAFAQNGGAQIPAAAARQSAGASDGLIALSETVDRSFQQVTIIDPRTQTMCVYHIEFSSGQISLRSVRKIQWDLRMTDYNGTKPLAQEVKALSEQ
jgi:hypothetical protein